MSKFFGLRVGKPTLEPLVTEEDVQLTRATLIWKNPVDENKTSSLIIRRDGEPKYVLCILSPNPGYWQVPLDIRLEKEGKFSFVCTNNNVFNVHLTGYTIPTMMEVIDEEEEGVSPTTEIDAANDIPSSPPAPPPPTPGNPIPEGVPGASPPQPEMADSYFISTDEYDL